MGHPPGIRDTDFPKPDFAGNIPAMIPHLFPGFSGLVAGVVIFAAIWVISYSTKEYDTFNLDPQGRPGAFEPLLAKYIRAAEFLVGLATSSIVLLVGSSAFRASGHLPWVYASPLVLLGFCVIYGILFMVLLVLNYENVQHGNPHTRLEYSRSEALGFSALSCFCIGYVWLILAVTR